MRVRKPPAAQRTRAYIGLMMNYTLFETAIGWAGLAWGDQGLVGVHLPEGERESARRGLLRRFPEAVEAISPDTLAAVIEGIRALLSGHHVDLSAAPLDIARVPPFNAQVYAIAQAIPAGETLTYGEIATRLGDRLLARDVGAALGQNPWPIIVPCHRVTASVRYFWNSLGASWVLTE